MLITQKKHGNFLRNTLRLLIGNASSQLINILSIPLITRLYDPGSYGMLSLFLSVSAMVIAISCLRFETVVLLPEDDSDAMSIFIISTFFIFIFSSFVGIGAGIVSFTTISLPSSYSVLEGYLWLMAFYVFIAGLYKALSFITVRNNDFTVQAVSRVSNSLVNKTFVILYALLVSATHVGLICGLLLGHFAACLIIYKNSFKKKFSNFSSLNFNRLKANFFRYKSFAIYSGTALLESFSQEMLLLLIGIYYSPTIIGLVGLTQRVAKQPLGVLGDAISRSFFQKLSASHRNKIPYGVHSVDLFKTMIAISLVPMLLFSIIAPEAFKIFFGPEWKVAGLYFSILGFSFLSGFLYRPFSIIFDLHERQRLRFYITLVRGLVCLTAFLTFASLLQSPLYAMAAYVVGDTIITFSIIFYLIHLSGGSFVSAIVNLSQKIAVGFMLIIPLQYCKFQTSNFLLWLLVTGFIAVYYIFIFFTDPKLKLLITNMKVSKK